MIFLELFYTFFVIGLFGFGGGYGMLSLIQTQTVSIHHWLTTAEFTNIVAISQMTPGPIGINSATYIGYSAPLMAGYTNPLWGILGSVVCTLTVVLPSFMLVAWTSHYIRRNRESVVIRGIFAGLRPVVIGLIASAALLLMNSDNFGDTRPQVLVSVIIAVAALCVVLFTKIHPIWVIVASGVAGFLIYY